MVVKVPSSRWPGARVLRILCCTKGFRPLARREPLEGEGHYTTELVFLWAMANKTHAGVSRALAKAARRQRTGQVRGALGNGQ